MAGKKRKSTTTPKRASKAATVTASTATNYFDCKSLDTVFQGLATNPASSPISDSDVKQIYDKFLTGNGRRAAAFALASRGYLDRCLEHGFHVDAPQERFLTCMQLMTYSTTATWKTVSNDSLGLLFDKATTYVALSSPTCCLVVMEWLHASLRFLDCKAVASSMTDYVGLAMWHHISPSRRHQELSSRTSLYESWNESQSADVLQTNKSLFLPTIAARVIELCKEIVVGSSNTQDTTMEILTSLLQYLYSILSAGVGSIYVQVLLEDMCLVEVCRSILCEHSPCDAITSVKAMLNEFDSMLFGHYGRTTTQSWREVRNAATQHLQQQIYKATKRTGFSFDSVQHAQQAEHITQQVKDMSIEVLSNLAQELGVIPSHPRRDLTSTTANQECLEKFENTLAEVRSWYGKKYFIVSLLVNRFQHRESEKEQTKSIPSLPTESQIWPSVLDPAKPLKLLHVPKTCCDMVSSNTMESFSRMLQSVSAQLINEVHQHLTIQVVQQEGNKSITNDWVMPLKTFKLLPLPSIRIGEVVPQYVRAVAQVGGDSSNTATFSWPSISPGEHLFFVTLLSSKNDDVQLVQSSDAPPVLVRTASVVKEEQRGSWCVEFDSELYQLDVEALAKLGGGQSIYDSFDCVVRCTSNMNHLMRTLRILRKRIRTENYTFPFEWNSNQVVSLCAFSDCVSNFESLEIGQCFGTATKAGNVLGSLGGVNVNVQTPTSDSLALRKLEKEGHYELVPSSKYRGITTWEQPLKENNQVESCDSSMAIASLRALQSGINLVDVSNNYQAIEVAARSVCLNVLNFDGERVAVISRNQNATSLFIQALVTEQSKCSATIVSLLRMVCLVSSQGEYSPAGRVDAILARRLQLLEEVGKIAEGCKLEGRYSETCVTAERLFVQHINGRITKLRQELDSVSGCDRLLEIAQDTFCSYLLDGADLSNCEEQQLRDTILTCLIRVEDLFSELKEYQVFEFLRKQDEREEYVVSKYSRIVVSTANEWVQTRFPVGSFGALVCVESSQLSEIELVSSTLQFGPKPLKRVTLIGNQYQLPKPALLVDQRGVAQGERSLWERYQLRGSNASIVNCPTTDLGPLEAARLNTFHGDDPSTSQMDKMVKSDKVCAGFQYPVQFVDVGQFEGSGQRRSENGTGWENVGEAEYAVAVYQYMRLIAYPSEAIAILCTTEAQRELVLQILKKRCGSETVFAPFCQVSTIAEFQGRVSRFLIVSTVFSDYNTEELSVLRPRFEENIIAAFYCGRSGAVFLGSTATFNMCASDRTCKLMHFFSSPSVPSHGKLNLVLGEGDGFCDRTESEDVDSENVYAIENLKAMGVLVAQLLQQVQ